MHIYCLRIFSCLCVNIPFYPYVIWHQGQKDMEQWCIRIADSLWLPMLLYRQLLCVSSIGTNWDMEEVACVHMYDDIFRTYILTYEVYFPLHAGLVNILLINIYLTDFYSWMYICEGCVCLCIHGLYVTFHFLKHATTN